MHEQYLNKPIGRRRLIQRSALAIVGVVALGMSSGCAGTKDAGKPLFSFVQLTDMHLNRPGDFGGYEKTTPKVKHVIDVINEEKNFPMPDFVILTGDTIHGGKLECLLPQCKFAKEMLSTLRCPYYTVIGNHEVVQREGDPDYQGPYEQVFGKDRVNYDFTHKGFHFVCLNNSNGHGDETGKEPIRTVTRKRNRWLAQTLQKHPQMPKIIACHIPMVPLRDEPVLKKSFGFSTYKMIGSGTWDIIRANNKTVVAVIHGHLHLTGVVIEDGIYHISPAGTASYPCHWAHYTVYRDRIDVRMYQVAKDLVTPAMNIHGIPRYKHGFTDSTHKTAEEYVCGTKAEQQFTIRIPKK